MIWNQAVISAILRGMFKSLAGHKAAAAPALSFFFVLVSLVEWDMGKRASASSRGVELNSGRGTYPSSFEILKMTLEIKTRHRNYTKRIKQVLPNDQILHSSQWRTAYSASKIKLCLLREPAMSGPPRLVLSQSEETWPRKM